MFYLPFSPRWLVSQGRADEAMAVLKRLHGVTEETLYIRAEYDKMVAHIEYEQSVASSSFKDLFNTRPAMHRTLCGVLVQVCGQWSGVNVASYFGPSSGYTHRLCTN